MEKLIIIGAGGFGKEVYGILRKEKKPSYEFLGFLDDNLDNQDKIIKSHRVIGTVNWLKNNPDVKAVIGIGNPIIKRKIAKHLESFGYGNFANVIDPKAEIGLGVKLGKGVIVCSGTIMTTDILVEDFVTVNLNCTIGHDSLLEKYTTLSPSVNISGNCTLKQGVDIGTCGTVIQGKTIEEWTIVGAGAVVVKDLPANVTAVGSPAKPIKVRESGWHL